MIVSRLADDKRNSWDAYVLGSTGAFPQQLSAWQNVMEATYGYKTNFLMAEDASGRITGVLPLFYIESLLTGRTATTMPGGLCADSEDVALALLEHGQESARHQGATKFVVQDSARRWSAPLQTSSDHVRWVVALPGDEETLWNGLHRNIRRQIRIARKQELRVVVDRSDESLDEFYHVLSHFTHQAGTPVFPLDFARNVVDNFREMFNIVVIYSGREPIGGYFQLEMGLTTYGLWGAALRQYLDLRPVYLAYWTILSEALRQGHATVDMGRSPTDSNASSFKRQWGGRSAPVFQQVAGLSGDAEVHSVTGQTQSDGRMRSFMQIWPRIPFPVAQFLGPRLRRHVPFA